MEIQQLLGEQQKPETGNEKETEHEVTDKKRKAAIFVLKMCNKYLRYMCRGCCFYFVVNYI